MPQRKKNKAQGTKYKEFCTSPKNVLSLVPCSLSSKLIGIGIDLLSLPRARDLLKRHGRSFFDRILSPKEKRCKPVCSNLQLARYFTAKEAFFKSANLPWTDLKGFSGMWIEKIRGNKFEMGCADPMLKGYGEFFKRDDIWGAKVQAYFASEPSVQPASAGKQRIER